MGYCGGNLSAPEPTAMHGIMILACPLQAPGKSGSSFEIQYSGVWITTQALLRRPGGRHVYQILTQAPARWMRNYLVQDNTHAHGRGRVRKARERTYTRSKIFGIGQNPAFPWETGECLPRGLIFYLT